MFYTPEVERRRLDGIGLGGLSKYLPPKPFGVWKPRDWLKSKRDWKYSFKKVSFRDFFSGAIFVEFSGKFVRCEKGPSIEMSLVNMCNCFFYPYQWSSFTLLITKYFPHLVVILVGFFGFHFNWATQNSTSVITAFLLCRTPGLSWWKGVEQRRDFRDQQIQSWSVDSVLLWRCTSNAFILDFRYLSRKENKQRSQGKMRHTFLAFFYWQVLGIVTTLGLLFTDPRKGFDWPPTIGQQLGSNWITLTMILTISQNWPQSLEKLPGL